MQESLKHYDNLDEDYFNSVEKKLAKVDMWIESLPDSDRLLLEQALYFSASNRKNYYDELAAIMGMSSSEVEIRCNRIRTCLREVMGYGVDDDKH